MGAPGVSDSGKGLYAGCPIMVTRNDYRQNLFNGDVGVIVRERKAPGLVGLFEDASVPDGYRHVPAALLTARQPCYAMTIHKSQGKTLENVLVDLGHGAFASGQVYVALSRCRSIDGIRPVRAIRRTDVKCDPMIKRFYLAIEDMKKDRRGEQPAATDG